MIDLALGATPSPPALAHLRGCSACSRELERLRSFARRIDVAVSALANERPPLFEHERVAAHVLSGAGSRRSRNWWPSLAAGFALAAFVASSSFRAPSPPDVTPLLAWHSPTAILLERK